MASAGATRKGLDSAGGVLVGGSPNVFANKAASVRIGDAVAGHGRSPHSSPVMATGSSSVFINGISACRRGDTATCGHSATGSFNVFIGQMAGTRVIVTQDLNPITTQDGNRLKE